MLKETIDWLLEDENLAIKYRTMTEICDIPLNECRDIYNLVLEHRTVLEMLNKQDENGIWANNYGSQVFTAMRYLTAFAEYGINSDNRLDNYANYIINFVLLANKSSDGFDYGGCLMPLLLRALVMLGYHRLPAVLELINRFAATQLYDGGFMCERLLNKRPERKSCYKASVAGLLLYAECKRKNILPDNSDKLIDYFLKRNVFYSSDKSKKFDDGRFGWRFVDDFFPVEPMRIGLPLIVAALSILNGSYSK